MRKIRVEHAIPATRGQSGLACMVHKNASMNQAPTAARISITDRCDMACIYCRPAEHDRCMPRERRLDVASWKEVFRALAALGVNRLRLTGGEPLLHSEVVQIVHAAKDTPGIDDVALTTNGVRLESLAKPLRDAGLTRINVSLDSLNETRFRALTRGGNLMHVLQGIRTACDVGFREIKTNTVVMGKSDDDTLRNDDELVEITRWAWSNGVTPRFIELMPIGIGAEIQNRLVTYRQMREKLVCLLGTNDMEGAADPKRGPARYVRAENGEHRRIGFITGTTRPFCDGCDRIRVTASGEVRACLARMDCVEIAESARICDADGLARSLREAWAHKPDTTSWRGSSETPARRVSMRVIGG